MKRLALVTASVLAACTLAACGSGSGGSAASTATSTGPRPHEPYKTQEPGKWDSPGVVVANDDGRKLVFDKSLPVYDPPVKDGGVAQTDWPVAGRLLSMKELIGVFPDATQIAFNPEGPTKLVITPVLSADSNPDKYPNTITITINDVGTENTILSAYDSKRASNRTVYTNGDGSPSSGHVYYKDGSFNTQRLSIEPDSGDKYDVVIGNGRTAMRLSIKYDGFISFYDSGNDDPEHVMRQQIMPLILQLLAKRM